MPLQRDINKIACADYFYEKEIQGDVEVEKQISVNESKYARSLRIVLDNRGVEKSQFAIISGFVFNLSWRTENNRVLMTSIMKNGFETVAEEMMGDKLKISRLQNKAFDEYFDKHDINIDRNDKARFMARAKPKLTKDMRAKMDHLLENHLPGLMQQFSSGTQSKLVTNNDISKHPVMSQMRWELCSVDSELILGDGGPIGFCENAEESGPLFWMIASMDVSHVFLPLSSNSYLLGSRSGNRKNIFSNKYSVDILNKVSAEQSYNFYITKCSETADLYADVIGSTHWKYQDDWSIQSLKSSM